MRHEFHGQLQLNAQQEKLLEYHSILNLFNVLELQLSALIVELSDPDINRFSRFCLDVLIRLPHIDIRKIIPDIRENCQQMHSKLIELRKQYPELAKILDGLIATTNVGHDRFAELESIHEEWQSVSRESLKSVLRTFLQATAAASGDRFSFSYSPEPPREGTYWIDFQIGQGEISVPGMLNDTIRDLVSNSRKYSEPGSSIRLRMEVLDSGGVWLAVIDEGMGIPAEEIPKVVDYGYRASNTLGRRTMGGGIGLTKAYTLCRRYDGNFVIESEVNRGTTVEITLYPPS